MAVHQDNTKRAQVLTDLEQIVKSVKGWKEVSFTVRTPEQVYEYPVAFIVGGAGDREPADIQLVHFDSTMDSVVYIYVRERRAGELARELEERIRLVADAVDEKYPDVRDDQGYDLYVSRIETDEGTLAAEGMTVAVGVITVRALLPAVDAPAG